MIERTSKVSLVLARAVRTWTAESGKTSMILPIGKVPRGRLLSHTKTISPGIKLGLGWVYFCLTCEFRAYSLTYLDQKIPAKYWT